jgi:hypothetical protein
LDRIGADPNVVALALIKGSQNPENLKASLVDLTMIGAYKVATVTTEFAAWSEALLADAPDDSLRPFLRMVYDNASKFVNMMHKHFESDTELSDRDRDAWFERSEEMIYHEFYEHLF